MCKMGSQKTKSFSWTAGLRQLHLTGVSVFLEFQRKGDRSANEFWAFCPKGWLTVVLSSEACPRWWIGSFCCGWRCFETPDLLVLRTSGKRDKIMRWGLLLAVLCLHSRLLLIFPVRCLPDLTNPPSTLTVFHLSIPWRRREVGSLTSMPLFWHDFEKRR